MSLVTQTLLYRDFSEFRYPSEGNDVRIVMHFLPPAKCTEVDKKDLWNAT